MGDLTLTCDRCGKAVRASTAWLRDALELDLCSHHSRCHEHQLRAQGFEPYGLAVQPVSEVAPRPVAG